MILYSLIRCINRFTGYAVLQQLLKLPQLCRYLPCNIRSQHLIPFQRKLPELRHLHPPSFIVFAQKAGIKPDLADKTVDDIVPGTLKAMEMVEPVISLKMQREGTLKYWLSAIEVCSLGKP